MATEKIAHWGKRVRARPKWLVRWVACPPRTGLAPAHFRAGQSAPKV
ncbi:hypothetical protein R9C00_23435 [Flammeovirgaceae bacterium SG7u.111]|nr:hypothetical protein [Flammeovirgaceae bacterium SG7u.132]WPO34658.1 hypothetical protein R9C00_23435 [Flammeovirgaceae bacterium SG7u.111]